MTLPSEYVHATFNKIKNDNEILHNTANHRYETRTRGNIQIKKPRLRCTEGSNLSIKLYNNLNQELKSLLSTKFKKELKKLLINTALYSVGDYFQ